MLAPVNRQILAVMLGLAGASGCVRVEAGTDAQALGYGPGPQAALSSGYAIDPVPRPPPTPWAAPPRELGFISAAVEAPPPGPVPYNADLPRVCARLESFASEWAEPLSCLARYRVERVFRPLPRWNTLAACTEAAADRKAAQACARATPRAFPPIAQHPRESEACMHVFALMLVEKFGPEPGLDSEVLLEFEPLLSQCVDSLTKSRATRKPAEYAEVLACIEAARSSSAAQRCQSLD